MASSSSWHAPHSPAIPTYLSHTLQLISALVVGSILAFFQRHLTHNGAATPWTFVFLTAASLLTIVSTPISLILHRYGCLPLWLSLPTNGALTVLWSTGFATLSWWTSPTLAHVCHVSYWRDENCIWFCGLFQALVIFTVLAFVGTLSALALDLNLHKKQSIRAVHSAMEEDGWKPDQTPCNSGRE